MIQGGEKRGRDVGKNLTRRKVDREKKHGGLLAGVCMARKKWGEELEPEKRCGVYGEALGGVNVWKGRSNEKTVCLTGGRNGFLKAFPQPSEKGSRKKK